MTKLPIADFGGNNFFPFKSERALSSNIIFWLRLSVCMYLHSKKFFSPYNRFAEKTFSQLFPGHIFQSSCSYFLGILIFSSPNFPKCLTIILGIILNPQNWAVADPGKYFISPKSLTQFLSLYLTNGDKFYPLPHHLTNLGKQIDIPEIPCTIPVTKPHRRR